MSRAPDNTDPEHSGADADSDASLSLRGALVKEASELDSAVATTIVATPTPHWDSLFLGLTKSANYSRLWLAVASAMALSGGRRGRRAATRGLIAVGVSSAIANLGVKWVFDRRRPDREAISESRRARMPDSSSFPSGHTASAFAFSAAVTDDFPLAALPLFALATGVGYSRVHLGVHFPGDVMAGAVLGLSVGTTVRVATRGLLPDGSSAASAPGFTDRSAAS